MVDGRDPVHSPLSLGPNRDKLGKKKGWWTSLGEHASSYYRYDIEIGFVVLAVRRRRGERESVLRQSGSGSGRGEARPRTLRLQPAAAQEQSRGELQQWLTFLMEPNMEPSKQPSKQPATADGCHLVQSMQPWRRPELDRMGRRNASRLGSAPKHMRGGGAEAKACVSRTKSLSSHFHLRTVDCCVPLPKPTSSNVPTPHVPMPQSQSRSQSRSQCPQSAHKVRGVRPLLNAGPVFLFLGSRSASEARSWWARWGLVVCRDQHRAASQGKPRSHSASRVHGSLEHPLAVPG